MQLTLQASLLNVSNLKRSIAFYRDVLDLRPVSHADRVAALMISQENRRQVLVLRETVGPHPLRAGRGSIGPRLLAFEAEVGE
jgi:catechol 2,3-dioxygenase-like lactoylglutathione lyase family enzyme